MLGLGETAAGFGGSMTGESPWRRKVPVKCYAVQSGYSLTLRGEAGFEYAVSG